jgi:sporulation protein YlmC with PRC-barrel domain
MLRSASKIFGYRLNGADGEVGRAVDLLFDDRTWTVRYLVVETGAWLDGRRVLISPLGLRKGEWTSRRLVLDGTRQQVETAPLLAWDTPVSREHEIELSCHYGWNVGAGLLSDSADMPPPEVLPPTEAGPSLRSLKELLGQALRAEDGEVGHVDDVILDDDSWTGRHLVVDSKNWLAARKMLVSTELSRVNWSERRVEVSLPAVTLESQPEYDPRAPVYEPRVEDLAVLPADNDVPQRSWRFNPVAISWGNPVRLSARSLSTWGTRGLKAALARIIHG